MPRFITDDEKKSIYIIINVKIYINRKSFFPCERWYKNINMIHKDIINIGIGVFRKKAKRK